MSLLRGGDGDGSKDNPYQLDAVEVVACRGHANGGCCACPKVENRKYTLDELIDIWFEHLWH